MNIPFIDDLYISKEEAYRAAMTVAHHSTDKRDAALLLEILGLLPPSEPVKSVRTMKYQEDRERRKRNRQKEYEKLGVTPEEVGDEPFEDI